MGLVRHAWACPTFSKITNCQYLWERLSYFVYLLHVVTPPGKLQCYHVVLVGYGPACPKFSEITHCQYLWRGLSDFVDFLHVVISILLGIHWSYQNLLFWAGIARHRLSANQIVRCFKLKKLEKLIVCFHRSYKRYHAILGYAAKYAWSISLQDFLLLTCLTC